MLTLLEQALQLPVSDRLAFADALLRSVRSESAELPSQYPPARDAAEQAEIDAAQMEEVERRAEEVLAGKVELIPYEVVRERIKAQFNI
jgi:hypothetical protein